eukprot:2606173-Rhodomonas_salina.1
MQQRLTSSETPTPFMTCIPTFCASRGLHSAQNPRQSCGCSGFAAERVLVEPASTLSRISVPPPAVTAPVHSRFCSLCRLVTTSQAKGIFGFVDSDSIGKLAFPGALPRAHLDTCR